MLASFFGNVNILNRFFKEHIELYIFEDKILDCNFTLGSLQERHICSLPVLHRPMAAHTVDLGDQGRLSEW